jgi:hypothetical protein
VLEVLNIMNDATIVKEFKRLKHKIGRLVLPDSPYEKRHWSSSQQSAYSINT